MEATKDDVRYLVTHGETVIGGPRETEFGFAGDPQMTAEGIARVASLKAELMKRLPLGPTEIHCGEGYRHYQVALALGYNLETHHIFFSTIWGGPVTLLGRDTVLLACGLVVPRRLYRSTDHLRDVVATQVRQLPKGSLICAGRPTLARLGVPPEAAESAALYAIRVEDDGATSVWVEIHGVNLMEVTEKAQR